MTRGIDLMKRDLTDIPSPLTVANAVDVLLQDLDEKILSVIRATDYADLIDHHFGLGLLIRNRLNISI